MNKTNSITHQVTNMSESELREEISKIEPEETAQEGASRRIKIKYNLQFAKDMRRVTKNSGSRRLEKVLQDIMSIIQAAAEDGYYNVYIYSWDQVRVGNPDVIVGIFTDYGYRVQKTKYDDDGTWKICISWGA